MIKENNLSPEVCAQVLSEALPYIQEFKDKTIVVKLGGSTMAQPQLLKIFAKDIALLHWVGMRMVLVHGGGPQIGKALESKGIKAEFIEGLRVSSDDVMAVVKKVLFGEVNHSIAKLLQNHQLQVERIDHTHQVFQCKPLNPQLGWVGSIEKIKTTLIEKCLQEKRLPLIAPLGSSTQNTSDTLKDCNDSIQAFNINADTAASSLAQSLKSHKLIMLTDTPGVLDEQGSLISELNDEQAKQLISNQTIYGGMIPKVKSALNALKGGVLNVHIIDGRKPHALLIELLTDGGIGTVIKKNKAL